MKCTGQAGGSVSPVAASLGGWEVDPITLFEVIERLSHADGSAGWTVLIGNNPSLMAWLDPGVAARMLNGNPDICASVAFAPPGRAVPDGNGSFTGRWPCNSGCPHSEWFLGGVLVMDEDQPRTLPSGRPDYRFAWFPNTDGEIIDTWYAAGLKGTGSHDVAVQGITVPEELTGSPMFEPARQDGLLYRLSFYNFISAHISGLPAGVGRRVLDEFAAVANTKHRRASPNPIADDPLVQNRFAIVDGGLWAARAFFIEAMSENWETVTRGDACSLQQRARVMSASQALHRAAIAPVDALLPLAGASAIYGDNPIQRCSRDLHASSQHIPFNSDVLTDIVKSPWGGRRRRRISDLFRG